MAPFPDSLFLPPLYLPLSALLSCQAKNISVTTFHFSPFCYIYTHIWYFWYCYLDDFCLCSITERVTKILLALQDFTAHRQPVLPMGGLWSLTISHFTPPKRWWNSAMPHGTICSFCQFLISFPNMFDNFLCHVQHFFMSYAVSLTSAGTKLVFSFSYTPNSTEVQSSLRDVLKAKRCSNFPE